MIFLPNASPLSSFHRDDIITDFSSARVFGSAKKSISKTQLKNFKITFVS